MTIRTKLNLAIAITIMIFMVAAAYAIGTVRGSAQHTQRYLNMRGQSQLTSDIRTDIYRHYAALRGSAEEIAAEMRSQWPDYLLEDIEVQVRLAELAGERAQWEALGLTVRALAELDLQGAPPQAVAGRVSRADRQLRAIRHLYDTTEHELIATIARAGLRAEAAILVACVLALLGFLVYVLFVRDWLIKPIEVLKRSADTIGQGQLDHRVALRGRNELAQLGRHLDAMAEGLAHHQTALLEARELSAVGELCRNVAHGLRNPLAAIRATAQMAARRDPGVGPAMGNVIEQVDRMDVRITQMLALSRPPKMQREDVTFGDLAAAAVGEAQPLIEARGILLRVEDACGPARWCLDRAQLACAVAELLTNAAHHSARGSHIVLHGRKITQHDAATHLEIEIRDEGSGMADATREQAFSLFFTSRPDGTGVGLSMVKRVVERHGGTVGLNSAVGQGTVVLVRLPATNRVARWSAPATNGKPSAISRAGALACVALMMAAMPARAATLAVRASHVNGIVVPGGPLAEIQAAAGDQLTVELALRDWAPQALRGYQLALDASSLVGSGGGVLTVAPRSCVIDTLRPDYPFAGLSVDPEAAQAFVALDPGPPGCRWTGGAIDTLFSAPDEGEAYLANLILQVPADAAGVFNVTLDAAATFLRDASSPPGAITPVQVEHLSVTVGAGCFSVAECADLDADGRRDDNCTWSNCAAGACVGIPIVFGDVGGSNGACEPDGAVDGNDNFHVLNCFSDQNTSGSAGYPCEPGPPDAMNVDAGGAFGGCAPDGVCDGHDAFHTLNVFQGISTCACPPGPAPHPGSADIHPADQAVLDVVSNPLTLQAGGLLEVQVHLRNPLPDLRGYQLHIAVRGGVSGGLELADISVGKRKDWVFRERRPWMAFNRATGQMVAGLDGPGVPVDAGYLATLMFRASDDAEGRFSIELLHLDSDPAQRSFLFATSPSARISIQQRSPAVVRVLGPRQPVADR